MRTVAESKQELNDFLQIKHGTGRVFFFFAKKHLT